MGNTAIAVWGARLALLGWLVVVFAGSAAAQPPEEGAAAGAQTASGVEQEEHVEDGEAAPHGEEHAGGANPLTIDPDLAIFTAIVFALLLLVLWKFAWRPISEGLTKREQMIALQIEEARLNNERAAELLRLHEAKLAATADEVRQMLAEARRDAEALKERILAEAQAEARRHTDRALEDITLAKESALRAIAQQSVDAAVELARNIVHREIQPEDHLQLIREALDKFPSKN